MNINVSQDCKDYCKYPGILIGSNPSWKIDIEYIALKIGKTVGLIAKLRHFPHPIKYFSVFYLSLHHLRIISLGSGVYKSYLNKLILQKRVLRFLYFAKKNEHTIPLFNLLTSDNFYVKASRLS